MTEWDDRLTDAAIWNHLERLENKLSDASSLAKEAGDSEALAAVERLQEVRSYVQSTLENVDPFLTSKKSLNNLAKAAQNAEQHVDNYLESGEASYLTLSGHDQNAAFYGDRMIVFVKQLPGLEPTEEVEQVRGTVTSFRRSAGQLMRRLEEDAAEAQKRAEEAIEEAGAKLEKYNDELTARLEKVEEEADEEQQTIQTRTEKRLSKLQTKIDQQEQRITDALDQFNSRFTEDQTERTQDFKKQLEQNKSRLDDLVEDLRGKASDLLNEMDKNKRKVEELTGLLGASGRTKAYEDRADYNQTQRDVWRIITVVALTGIVGVGVWLALGDISSTDGVMNWSRITAKLTLMGALGVLSGYASRQAKKHHQRSVINRQLQLELTSIEPYLAGFEEKTQRQIKKAMVWRWFGNLPTFDKDGGGKKIPEEAEQLISDWFRQGNVEE